MIDKEAAMQLFELQQIPDVNPTLFQGIPSRISAQLDKIHDLKLNGSGNLPPINQTRQELNQSKSNIDEKPESTRKTENLLRALTCIAIDAYGYDPQSGRNTAPKDIADAMLKYGFEKDDKTIRNWLKEGADLLPPIRTNGNP